MRINIARGLSRFPAPPRLTNALGVVRAVLTAGWVGQRSECDAAPRADASPFTETLDFDVVVAHRKGRSVTTACRRQNGEAYLKRLAGEA